MAKKVEGYIKLQIPWTARRKHRRVYKTVQRKDS